MLENSIYIDASPEHVWSALGRLEALHESDPGISKVGLSYAQPAGLGADRHCHIRGGGWFRERVTVWKPAQELEFTLYECTLPVRKLRHHYSLTPEGRGTRVDQVKEYTLKYG